MTYDDADVAGERAAALLAGPTACAFLLLVDANELPPAVAARPPVAFALAASACNATDPWAVDDIDVRNARVLERAQPLRALAERIAAESEAVWWWSDLDRRRQHVVRSCARAGAAMDASAVARWSRYAQRSIDGHWTSTVVGGTSGLAMATALGVGDLDPDEAAVVLPVAISADARVFEVHGPLDWHALAVGHASASQGAGCVEPDWGRVATAFDVVHLSFAGLLTARWRMHTDAQRLTSCLWTWEAESSHVLNEGVLRDPLALSVSELDALLGDVATSTVDDAGESNGAGAHEGGGWFRYARQSDRRRR